MYASWNLPIKVVSEPNSPGHWSQRYKRGKAQKLQVWAAFHNDQPEIKLPCEVTLTRFGPRELDYDNLVASFKAIRDEIADNIIPGMAPGFADSSPEIEWNYKQKKSKEYAVQIDIT